MITFLLTFNLKATHQKSDFSQTSSGGKKRFNELSWKEAMKWVELSKKEVMNASLPFNTIIYFLSIQYIYYFPPFQLNQTLGWNEAMNICFKDDDNHK